MASRLRGAEKPSGKVKKFFSWMLGGGSRKPLLNQERTNLMENGFVGRRKSFTTIDQSGKPTFSQLTRGSKLAGLGGAAGQVSKGTIKTINGKGTQRNRPRP